MTIDEVMVYSYLNNKKYLGDEGSFVTGVVGLSVTYTRIYKQARRGNLTVGEVLKGLEYFSELLCNIKSMDTSKNFSKDINSIGKIVDDMVLIALNNPNRKFSSLWFSRYRLAFSIYRLINRRDFKRLLKW